MRSKRYGAKRAKRRLERGVDAQKAAINGWPISRFDNSRRCKSAVSDWSRANRLNLRILSFISSVGKNWAFAAGSTQTVQRLTVQGVAGLPLQLRSATPGQIAYINLTGTQSVAHIGVTDLGANGLPLAPDLVNEGGSNASRWFGAPDYTQVPTLSESALLILMLLIGAIAARTLSTRERPA